MSDVRDGGGSRRSQKVGAMSLIDPWRIGLLSVVSSIQGSKDRNMGWAEGVKDKDR